MLQCRNVVSLTIRYIFHYSNAKLISGTTAGGKEVNETSTKENTQKSSTSKLLITLQEINSKLYFYHVTIAHKVSGFK